MDLFPVPVEVMIMLKTLTREDAQEFLAKEYPDLAAEDVAALLQVTRRPQAEAPTSPAPSMHQPGRMYVVDPKRNHFFFVANLAGVSQYILGRLFGITRQTVYSAIRSVKESHDAGTLPHRSAVPRNILQAAVMRDWYFATPEVSTMTLSEILSNLNAVADACTDNPNE